MSATTLAMNTIWQRNWPIVGEMPMPRDFRHTAVLRRGRPRHGRPGKMCTYDLFYIKHPPMECSRRAKLFAPFDALAGFSQCIKAKQVLYCERRKLTEGEQEELDARAAALYRLTLNSKMARENAVRVSITYFDPCKDIHSESYTEDGRFGQYKTITGIVCKVDIINQKLILWTTDTYDAPGKEAGDGFMEMAISVSDITDIESEQFKKLYRGVMLGIQECNSINRK